MTNNRATAHIVLDSISQEGVRLTTFQLRYWRPIHSELMTHRVFSRNAGSSRARPSQKIIEQVRSEPWGPIHWGVNQAGMQAHTEMDPISIHAAKGVWHRAAKEAAENADALMRIGAHKQIVNRLLEPFTYIDVLVTATDYANWFMLRNHADAQPEIRELAKLMDNEYRDSWPKLLHGGEWHLPYITETDWREVQEYCRKGDMTYAPSYQEKLGVIRKISVARCARVSYKAFDGTVAPIEKDIELFEQLVVSQPLHASPAEHQATPDRRKSVIIKAGEASFEDPFGEKDIEKEVWAVPELHGNFRGWCQYRKMLPNEFLPG